MKIFTGFRGESGINKEMVARCPNIVRVFGEGVFGYMGHPDALTWGELADKMFGHILGRIEKLESFEGK